MSGYRGGGNNRRSYGYKGGMGSRRGISHRMDHHKSRYMTGALARVAATATNASILVVGEGRTTSRPIQGTMVLTENGGWRQCLQKAANHVRADGGIIKTVLFNVGVNDIMPLAPPALADTCWQFNPNNTAFIANMAKTGLELFKRLNPQVTHYPHPPSCTTINAALLPLTHPSPLYIIECHNHNISDPDLCPQVPRRQPTSNRATDRNGDGSSDGRARQPHGCRQPQHLHLPHLLQAHAPRALGIGDHSAPAHRRRLAQSLPQHCCCYLAHPIAANN